MSELKPDHLTMCLLAVYVLLACWYAVERSWGKSLYWFGAAMLTSGVLMQK